MSITVELQKMHSYSLELPIVAGVVWGLFIVTLIAILIKKLRASKANMNRYREITIQDREQIKAKYIGLLNGLEARCRSGKVSNRKAYQELSKITRNYVYETTGVKVQNYTLDEIRDTKMAGLYNVVNDCYAPEFSIDKNGDIYSSIAKARKVVEGWN